MTTPDIIAQYHRRQQYVPGWQDLSALLCTQILSAAQHDEGCTFLRLVGSQLARQFPLREVETLGLMEDDVNAVLARFGWGAIRAITDDNGLVVQHMAWPVFGQEHNLVAWGTGFASLMEGCWKTWLESLGAGRDITFYWTGEVSDVLTFRYGNKRI